MRQDSPPTTADLVRRRRVIALSAFSVVVLAITGIFYAATRGPDREAAINAYVKDWREGDFTSMFALTGAGTRKVVATPQEFTERFVAASKVATAIRWDFGKPRDVGDDIWAIPVKVRTNAFGLVQGDVKIEVTNEDGAAKVRWTPSAVFPGMQNGEQLSRTTQMPPRADLLASDGTLLAGGDDRAGDAGASAADIVGALGPIPEADRPRAEALGYPADAQVGQNGLERILDKELAGRPGGTLKSGTRVLATTQPQRAKPVRSTINPKVQDAAVEALAGRLGGITVLDPRNGEILAVAGVAFSGLQPPGSTFKIITAAGALENKIVKMTDEFPAETYATLSGVQLQNSFGEACGGSLATSFAKSCNSVFAPLGAKLGAEKLVKTAEAFGFNTPTGIAGAATASIPPADQVGDDLGVGSTAIGQGKVQATALTMAIVAATVGLYGQRPAVTMQSGRWAKAPTKRAISAATARRVERLMEAVVKPGGTGNAAAISGVKVAGKTGTAELTSTQNCTPDPANPDACATEADPSNTTAWFAAYAPAGRGAPRVAVAVDLVGQGHGGDTAAPAARAVLFAALKATR